MRIVLDSGAHIFQHLYLLLYIRGISSFFFFLGGGGLSIPVAKQLNLDRQKNFQTKGFIFMSSYAKIHKIESNLFSSLKSSNVGIKNFAILR
jgi:hypothetical protein